MERKHATLPPCVLKRRQSEFPQPTPGTGQEKDKETASLSDPTGEMHYRALAYSPRQMRFLQNDPPVARRVEHHSAYVANPVQESDPDGMGQGFWKRVAKLLGYAWSADTARRAAKRLSTELLENLRGRTPDDPIAKELITDLTQEGWVVEPLKKSARRSGASLEEGGGLIVRDPDGDIMLQWHPGGGRHGAEPYWKLSSGSSGTSRTLIGAMFALLLPNTSEAVANPQLGAHEAASAGIADASNYILPVGWGDIEPLIQDPLKGAVGLGGKVFSTTPYGITEQLRRLFGGKSRLLEGFDRSEASVSSWIPGYFLSPPKKQQPSPAPGVSFPLKGAYKDIKVLHQEIDKHAYKPDPNNPSRY